MKKMAHKETLTSGSRKMARPQGASVQSGLSKSMFANTNRPYGDATLHMESAPGTKAGGYMRESKMHTTGRVGGGFKIDGGSK